MSYNKTTTPEKERDTWSTPQYIYNWLNDTFQFNIDLAASAANAKCSVFFNKDADGLSHDWHTYGISGFCNPPYSETKLWIAKAIEEAKLGFTTAMLIPMPNGESYYHHVFQEATEIIFITGRLAFIDAQGKPKSGNNRGSCVVIFAPSPYTGYSYPTVSEVSRATIQLNFT